MVKVYRLGHGSPRAGQGRECRKAFHPSEDTRDALFHFEAAKIKQVGMSLDRTVGNKSVCM